jgi:hypothetical protein
LDDDDEVLENKNSCTMAGGEPTYLVMRGGNPGCIGPILGSILTMVALEGNTTGGAFTLSIFFGICNTNACACILSPVFILKNEAYN